MSLAPLILGVANRPRGRLPHRVTRAEFAASGDLFDTGYEPRMARVHARSAQRLRRVIESVGWPGTDLVGPDGAEAAWLILQHAIAEPDLLRSASPLLETAARERRADPAHAAMLEDRIRFFEGRPQRYGTQLDWDAEGGISLQARWRTRIGWPSADSASASPRWRNGGGFPPAGGTSHPYQSWRSDPRAPGGPRRARVSVFVHNRRTGTSCRDRRPSGPRTTDRCRARCR